MRVSVCLATHNGALYLREQMDSILCQLGINDELVISDDGSTDATLEVVHSYHSSHIKLLPHKEFKSPIKNFEYILTSCKNEIIFLADQDDVWHSEKVAIMKAALNDCDLVVCDCRITDEKLYTLFPSFFDLNKSKKGLMKNFYKSSFVGCCMAFHRKVLTKALPFPAEISMHDQWIGLVAQKHFRVKFIPQILVDHRRHGQNYSSTSERSKNSFGKKVISRFKLAKILLQR